MICKFFPAVSRCRCQAARRLGRQLQRARPGWAVFKISRLLAPIATMPGGALGASAASSVSSGIFREFAPSVDKSNT